MKELTFKVTLPKKAESFSIMDSIVDTANDEQRQLKLTREINVKTLGKHLEVAAAVQKDLNKQFKRIGFGIHSAIETYGNTNGYSYPYFSFVIGNNEYKVKICGDNFRNFEHSKYLTFTGDYHIELIRNGYPWDQGSRMKDTEDILKQLKDQLIEWYKKNPQRKK